MKAGLEIPPRSATCSGPVAYMYLSRSPHPRGGGGSVTVTGGYMLCRGGGGVNRRSCARNDTVVMASSTRTELTPPDRTTFQRFKMTGGNVVREGKANARGGAVIYRTPLASRSFLWHLASSKKPRDNSSRTVNFPSLRALLRIRAGKKWQNRCIWAPRLCQKTLCPCGSRVVDDGMDYCKKGLAISQRSGPTDAGHRLPMLLPVVF